MTFTDTYKTKMFKIAINYYLKKNPYFKYINILVNVILHIWEKRKLSNVIFIHNDISECRFIGN